MFLEYAHARERRDSPSNMKTCCLYQLASWSLPVQETYGCFGKCLIVSARRNRDDSEGNHCKLNRVRRLGETEMQFHILRRTTNEKTSPLVYQLQLS